MTDKKRTATITVLTPATDDPIEYWAGCVFRSYSAGIQNFILTGRALEDAVEDFKRRDEGHWKHAYGELLRRVNMSQPMAHRLRSIAKHPALSQRQHFHKLPANWSTLAEIATLPEQEVIKRIKAGGITPETKNKDVRAWKQSNHAKSHGSSEQSNANKCLCSPSKPKDNPRPNTWTDADEETYAALLDAWELAAALLDAWELAPEAARREFIHSMLNGGSKP